MKMDELRRRRGRIRRRRRRRRRRSSSIRREFFGKERGGEIPKKLTRVVVVRIGGSSIITGFIHKTESAVKAGVMESKAERSSSRARRFGKALSDTDQAAKEKREFLAPGSGDEARSSVNKSERRMQAAEGIKSQVGVESGSVGSV